MCDFSLLLPIQPLTAAQDLLEEVQSNWSWKGAETRRNIGPGSLRAFSLVIEAGSFPSVHRAFHPATMPGAVAVLDAWNPAAKLETVPGDSKSEAAGQQGFLAKSVNVGCKQTQAAEPF